MYELVLPGDNREQVPLLVGDSANLTLDGDADPLITIEHLGEHRTRITIRSDYERLTADDLLYLSAHLREPVH